MRQGGFPILKMSPRTDPVSGFSAAVTETAVIEQKNRQTGLSKTLGKWLKSECSFRSKAVRHYDDRRSCHSSWEVQPCSAPRTTRHKINIAANPLSRSHAQIPVRDWDYDLSVPLIQASIALLISVQGRMLNKNACCSQCKQVLIEIDHCGGRLTGA